MSSFGKGGPAGSFRRRQTKRSSAASRIQAAARRKAAARKKKTGLNKVEKKQVKSIIKSRKEDKYCPAWFQYDDFAAYGPFLQPAIQGSSILPGIFNNVNSAVTVVGLQMGNYLTSAATDVNTVLGAGTMSPLGGIGMERGDTSTTIDGDFATMKSCKLQLQVNANVMAANGGPDYEPIVSPLEFRVLQVRPKANTPSGTTPSLIAALFLDNTNTAEGLGAAGSVKEVMSDWRVNRNQFQVIKDIKFTLTNPMSSKKLYGTNQYGIAQAVNNLGSESLKNVKTLDFWMNRPQKKLRFAASDTGLTYYEPTNYQFQEYVIILCSRRGVAQDSVATALPVPLPSTSRYWTVRSNGMTKYRDI